MLGNSSSEAQNQAVLLYSVLTKLSLTNDEEFDEELAKQIEIIASLLQQLSESNKVSQIGRSLLNAVNASSDSSTVKKLIKGLMGELDSVYDASRLLRKRLANKFRDSPPKSSSSQRPSSQKQAFDEGVSSSITNEFGEYIRPKKK